MRVPYIFRNSNTVVSVGLKRPEVDYINSIKVDNLKKLHIFAYLPEDVNIKSLRNFAEYAKDDGITVVVHCFSKRVRRAINRELQDVEKGKHFHFRVEKEYFPFRISLNDEKFVEIKEDGIKILYKNP